MLWVDTDASPATLYICTSISPVTFEVVGPATVASPLTTKGDIWGYSNTNARIPVQSNGKVLTADSTAALGVSWQTPTASDGDKGDITISGSGTVYTIDSDVISTYGRTVTAAASAAAARTVLGTIPEAPTDGSAYVRQSAAWVAQAGSGGSGGTSGNFLVNGGGVAWSTGLSLIVSAASYVIQGTSYSSVLTTLTLGAADPTNPRIDVIALNSSGNAVVIAGTPAANPEKPDVNPVTQLEISFIYVPATATVPSVTVTEIYFEGVEWTATRSGTGFTIGSTNNPYAGTKDIEGTAVPTGDYVNFEAPSAFDPNNYDKLVLYIRSKATWDSTRALNLTFRNNGGSQKGVIIALRHGSYGFDSSITNAYQQIVIPVVDFAAGGISCKMFRATMGGTGTAPGMYLDNIQFQTGLAPAAANLNMRWRGDYNAATAYSTNDAVMYQGVLWVATNNGTGNTPSTSSTFWQDATGPATSAGLSVVGRSANTTGSVADITAANDAEVLRRSGTSIGFGTVATAGIADDAVTYAKMQNVAGFSIPAKATTGSGDLADLTAGNDTVLGKQGSGNLAFSTIAAGQIASDAVTTAKILDANVTYAKLQNVAGLSLVGRSASSTGVPAAITATTNGQVMQMTGGALAFAALGASFGGAVKYIGQSIVAGAAATSLASPTLDLNTDGMYFVQIMLNNATVGNISLTCTFNADTTAGNYDTEVIGASGGSVGSAGANDAVQQATWTTGSPYMAFGFITNNFDVKPVTFMLQSNIETTVRVLRIISTQWRTASTNVTSFTMTSNQASGLDIGSRIRVWSIGTV